MDKKIGFIGVGNMSGAILRGLLKTSNVPANNIHILDSDVQKLQKLTEELGVQQASDIEQLTKNTDIIIIGVKPKDVASVLNQVSPHLNADTILVSIAAGVTLVTLAGLVGTEQKIIRVMPNTPALVGEGVSSITPNVHVSEQELEWVKAIFSHLGKAEVVPESLIHAVAGVSGSAPAYVFMFIEAMADAAVLGGMPREQAYTFAAQTVLGSAKMVLETGMHPGELKDMVCSPAGTTIEAVRTLENRGFRSAVIEAIISCMDKSEAMSNQ